MNDREECSGRDKIFIEFSTQLVIDSRKSLEYILEFVLCISCFTNLVTYNQNKQTLRRYLPHESVVRIATVNQNDYDHQQNTSSQNYTLECDVLHCYDQNISSHQPIDAVGHYNANDDIEYTI